MGKHSKNVQRKRTERPWKYRQQKKHSDELARNLNNLSLEVTPNTTLTETSVIPDVEVTATTSTSVIPDIDELQKNYWKTKSLEAERRLKLGMRLWHTSCKVAAMCCTVYALNQLQNLFMTDSWNMEDYRWFILMMIMSGFFGLIFVLLLVERI